MENRLNIQSDFSKAYDDFQMRCDIVAGGDPDDVSRMGDRQINSSIGPQWTKSTRIGALETYAKDAVTSGRGGDLMNVELRMC